MAKRAYIHNNKKDKKEIFESFEDITVKSFHLEFKHPLQKLAWTIFQQHDILFLLGPAGTGKSHLATAFAIHDILSKTKKKIICTRPVVEAGENLGFLPGTLEEKVDPYMLPICDCISKLCGYAGSPTHSMIMKHYEVAPLAYLRGRTFQDSICILDEAQNCTKSQLKLFLTRLGTNSKMIVTGDPKQSDLPGEPAIVDVVRRLEPVNGVGVLHFTDEAIVRHPLVGEILKRLDTK